MPVPRNILTILTRCSTAPPRRFPRGRASTTVTTEKKQLIKRNKDRNHLVRLDVRILYYYYFYITVVVVAKRENGLIFELIQAYFILYIWPLLFLEEDEE